MKQLMHNSNSYAQTCVTHLSGLHLNTMLDTEKEKGDRVSG